MKTRTLAILVLGVVFLAAGALVLRGDGKKSIADWFMTLLGRPGGH